MVEIYEAFVLNDERASAAEKQAVSVFRSLVSPFLSLALILVV